MAAAVPAPVEGYLLKAPKGKMRIDDLDNASLLTGWSDK